MGGRGCARGAAGGRARRWARRVPGAPPVLCAASGRHVTCVLPRGRQTHTKLQVRLRLPADVEGSVSLRSEHEGFWSSSVSSMLQSLFRRAGVNAAVDEFFFQDQWEPPQGLAERALLFFGDPLQRVEVPWRPQSLIQNWAAAV